MHVARLTQGYTDVASTFRRTMVESLSCYELALHQQDDLTCLLTMAPSQ